MPKEKQTIEPGDVGNVADVIGDPAAEAAEATKALAKPSIVTGGIVGYDPRTSPAEDAVEKSGGMPLVTVFQGLPDERERYEGLELNVGDTIISRTGEKLFDVGKSRSCIIVNRRPQYVLNVWEPGHERKRPLFSFTIDRHKPVASQVPENWLTDQGKLTSFDIDEGEFKGYQVRLCWCYVAFLEPEGDEKWETQEAVVLSFTWTSQSVGEMIEGTEKTRARNGQCGAMWRLGTRDRSNTKGKWKATTVAVAGDPTDEAKKKAKEFQEGRRVDEKPLDMDW